MNSTFFPLCDENIENLYTMYIIITCKAREALSIINTWHEPYIYENKKVKK